jgi:hypothetical protein
MIWETCSHVHVDRVVGPGLIMLFMDHEAQFLFVLQGEIERILKDTTPAALGQEISQNL